MSCKILIDFTVSQRGENHFLNLNEEFEKMIYDYCQSIPHTESHYSRDYTNLNYFTEPGLTLKSLYGKCIAYYQLKTGIFESPIAK